MSFHLWLLVIGGLLLGIGFLHPLIKRLPITTTIVYLLVGIALGPAGFNALTIEPLRDSAWLHHGAEIAVIISLFTVGMKLRLNITDRALRPAIGLAFASMALTVALIAVVGVVWLHLPVGAAILLGAVLAPTDPVLASDVQMQHAKDRDRVRMTLSVESGLNDGTAFPFVMLGLGLLGLRELGELGGRWVLMDVLWAAVGGLLIGWLLGHGVGRLLLAVHGRSVRMASLGEYLVLGLIGLSYGITVQMQAYGFLAVFAAGVALRSVERNASARSGLRDLMDAEEGSITVPPNDPRAVPAHLAGTLLTTNEQLEHILEVALVVLVGASLASISLNWHTLAFALLLFSVLRPLACLPVVHLARFSRVEAAAVAWFGIRGIGSVYYMMYAVDEGLSDQLAEQLTSVTLTVIALSIVLHGISVTPLLNMYAKRRGRNRSG